MRPDLMNLGPFGLHMSDPAWKTKDKLPGPGRGAAKKYKVMSTEAIASMRAPRMKFDAVLILWRIACMTLDADRVARAWGFEPKAEIVWRKMRRCGPCDGTGKISRATKGSGIVLVTSCEACDGRGERLAFGMGHHVRACHETAILATRGSPKRINANIHSTFDARMPEDENGELIHSAKPPEVYDLIERLYPGPYVETFARNTRPGWVGLGDQVPEVVRER